ncbi:MAG: TM0996/MTH895 family glutaredoxin-like protein [Chromatiaceae bacterium]|nr:TM0996/MTH895 family glutaredoxin-like protein [Chromatiaceae bacterium]MBP6733711.1 TM0996/MTH895 family glutaredoxin-like protein [Chromatiaceae bacterium]MBP6807085.1 TM0996/MTH895 family glutaredoxin-like protein [Chromatiaceae bacterium]MBP9604624.1 TM0996/MTH895 family glutaredoxin-like protein [Chromatiaceae bacterium]
MIKLQILGSGCAKCATLALNADVAARSLALDYELEKVTDINAIIDAGIMSTPALAVDGEVKSVGRVLSVAEIKQLLTA